MGKEQRERPRGQDETQAHRVNVSPWEDRGGTAGKMGKGPCEESG
jgi:tRNA(adenine34) deaminase